MDRFSEDTTDPSSSRFYDPSTADGWPRDQASSSVAWPDSANGPGQGHSCEALPKHWVHWTKKPLHVLIELNRPHNSPLHPILIAHREINARGPAHPVQWIPVLVATPIGRTTLHNICAPPCRSDQLLVPMAGRVRRWMSQENGRPIYSGLFLPVWWDVRIQPPPNPAYEEDDQQALLQVAPVLHQPADSRISHVSDRWCRSVEDAGSIAETDDSDSVWMMQIADTSPARDLCCQQLLVQKFNELEAGREGIRICSHGLSGISVGSRYFMIPAAQLPLLKQAIRSNWPEFLDASGRLYFVHPQPQDTLRPSWRTCIHIVVEFSADETAMPGDVAPALEESVVWNAYGTASVKHTACYYARRTHFRDVTEKFEHLCVRATFKCIVRVEGHRLHPDETAEVADGTCVQLHALPEVSAPPQAFANYFWHCQQFLGATANLLAHWVLPSVTWSFHILDDNGYQGYREYRPSTSELQSSDQIVTVMYHLWQERTPDALAFTGLIQLGESATLHFLGFPPDSDLVPGLVWRDVSQTPYITALWLPRAATVLEFCQAFPTDGSPADPASMAVVVDGIEYLSHDRFRPRAGALYLLRPALPSDEEEMSMLQVSSPAPLSSRAVVLQDVDTVDALHLMQRSGSRTPRRELVTPTSVGSSLSPILAHVFHLSAEHRLITFDRDAPLSFFQQLDTLWKRPAHAHSIALHEVKTPPPDLETSADVTFVYEQAPDRNRQAVSTDQLILLDIETFAHGETTPGRHIRRVLWSRRMMNRQAMLTLTASVSICEVPGTTCELSINRHIWPEHDTANRHMLHGDFVRLRIDAASPSDELHMALCEQESADAQRYVFGRSPSRSPTPTDSAQPDEEEGPSGEAASSSLLQLRSAVTVTGVLSDMRKSDDKTNGNDRLRVSVGLKEMCEPHVDDLWCALPSPSNSLGLPDHIPIKRCITLADKVEGPTNLRIPCGHLKFLRSQLLEADLGPILDRGQVVKWHEATLQALASTPDWTGEFVNCYSFYTDGSSIRTSEGRAGASAVVLILHTDPGPRFGGIRAYTVPGHATAPRSEALAMLFALLWAHQVGQLHPEGAPLQIEIGYDCLSAGHAAAGQWAINANVDIQYHCRALTQWLHQRFGECIAFYHIASHTGHAWNEGADAVTWSAVNGWMGSWLPVDVIQQMTLDDRFPMLTSWLWMLEASLQGAPGGPRIDNNSFVIDVAAPFKTAPSAAGHPIAVRQQRESPVTTSSTSDVTLSVATANVLTLYPGGERPGAYVSARHEQLMRQCFELELHIVGVQETRSRMDGYYEGEHYHVISAPASSAGVGGTQLWISRVFKFQQKALTVSHRWIQVYHSTSQSLCVAFSAPWLRLMIVVGHAPSGGDEPSEAFWRTLAHSIPQSHRGWPTIFLLDANARVGSIQSEAVGSWGATEENTNGALFHQWLIDHHLFLPQTFATHHSGSHDTWEHGRGVRARLDYVALDESLRHPNLRTSVLEDLDLGIQRLDHMAVRADIPLCIADLENTKRFKAAWGAKKSSQTAPIGHIPWQVDVHTHATLLAQQTSTYVVGAARQRKAHLQEATWTMIQWKRYHWKRCNQLRTIIGQSKMRLWFLAWKHVRRTEDIEEGTSWLRQAQLQYAFHSYHLSCLAPLVAQRVKQDDIQFYKELSQRTARCAADEGFPHLWKVLKPMLPKATAKRKSNIRCIGPTVEAMSSHFNSLEAGQGGMYQELLNRCHRAQVQACQEAPLTMSLEDIPTMIEMEQVVLRQKRNKAPGLDGVSASALQDAVRSDPRPFYDLIFKSWVTAAEPLQYKGGLVHCIAKKSGGRDVKAMRGITLLDSFGKCYHALARSALLHGHLQETPNTIWRVCASANTFRDSVCASICSSCRSC